MRDRKQVSEQSAWRGERASKPLHILFVHGGRFIPLYLPSILPA